MGGNAPKPGPGDILILLTPSSGAQRRAEEASAAVPAELTALAAHTQPAQRARDMCGCVVHHPPQPKSTPSAGMASPKGVLGIKRGHSLPLPPKTCQPSQPHCHQGQRERLGMLRGTLQICSTMEGDISQFSSARGPCYSTPCPQARDGAPGTHRATQTACGEPGGTAASSAAASQSAPCGWRSASCPQ